MNSYDASGHKLAARNFTNVVALSQPLNEGEVLKHVVDENERVYISSVHNIDNVEYNSLTTYNFSTASAVESIQFSKLYNSEGYVAESSTSTSSQLTNPEYYYFCRDHLGNIREVWRGNRRTVVQRTQYYPSGLPWAKNAGDDTELPANANNRKYNGKEWVEMHGLDEYDSEARWYYPAIMRTTTIDPHAENYYSISPYAWCANNPVLMVDPDGRDWYKYVNQETNEQSILWQEGNANTITLNGIEHKNIGETYSHTVENATYNYNQNSMETIVYTTGAQFQAQSTGTGCKVASDNMVRSSGGTPSVGRAGEILMANHDTNGVVTTPTAYVAAGVNRIERSIQDGHAISIGVDYKPIQQHNLASSGGDGMTDHFITVVSMTYNVSTGNTTYSFFDPGSPRNGSNASNTMSLRGGFLQGRTASFNQQFKVTTIRQVK